MLHDHYAVLEWGSDFFERLECVGAHHSSKELSGFDDLAIGWAKWFEKAALGGANACQLVADDLLGVGCHIARDHAAYAQHIEHPIDRTFDIGGLIDDTAAQFHDHARDIALLDGHGLGRAGKDGPLLVGDGTIEHR